MRDRVVDKVAQRSMKTQKVLNFARSAKAPVISAGVIMANISWKIMNVWCGIVRRVAGWASEIETSLRPTVEAADDAAVVGPEGQRVADEHELDADQPEHDEALHDRAEHVLASGPGRRRRRPVLAS